ncbi:MAG: hypothetical protein K1T65_09810 [Candidatus Aramenus sp.]|nr:hypothetical protein [Candidatus Aramenus sp.]
MTFLHLFYLLLFLKLRITCLNASSRRKGPYPSEGEGGWKARPSQGIGKLA